MSFGLEIYSATGDLRVSLSETLGRIIELFSVGANESGSRQYNLNTVGAPNGLVGIAITAPVGNQSFMGLGHSITITTAGSVATVSYSPIANFAEGRVASNILVLPK